MTKIAHAAIAAAVIGLCAVPAAADEVEESLRMALEAYQAGDIDTAKEEVDFAAQLISQMKAAGLANFLPASLPGWERTDNDMSAAFGGGHTASATYTRGQDRIEVQLMANNQMVTAMGAMFNNAALMGSMGEVKRINRQKVVITREGDVQAMVDGRIMVQVMGQAPIEDKEAYFAEIDIKGLEDF